MGPQLYRCGNIAAALQGLRQLAASMGPQLYRCGNSATAPETTGSRSCFNGAATLSLRKSATPSITTTASAPLQWGRNFIVAEISHSQHHYHGQRTASMGPQLYRCGNQPLPASLPRPAHRFNGAATLSLRKSSSFIQEIVSFMLASMGPQLYRCGNGAELADFNISLNASMGAATLSLRKYGTRCWCR